MPRRKKAIQDEELEVGVEETTVDPNETSGFDLNQLCESADDPTTNPAINYEKLVNNFAQHYSMDDLIPPVDPPILDEG